MTTAGAGQGTPPDCGGHAVKVALRSTSPEKLRRVNEQSTWIGTPLRPAYCAVLDGHGARALFVVMVERTAAIELKMAPSAEYCRLRALSSATRLWELDASWFAIPALKSPTSSMKP